MKMSGECGKIVCMVWGECLEGVGLKWSGFFLDCVRRQCGGCGEALWSMWESFVKVVGIICLKGMGRLSGGCREADCRVR